MLEPKKATQRAYFSMIETACSLKKPVIIDTDSLQAKKEKRDTWVGNDSTYVLAEKKRNANAVGRMRISHDYSPNVIEIWGDVDANKKMKTRQEVCAHFKELHEATMRWIDAHLKMGIPEDCVYVVSSGFGFHTHVFIEGIGSFEEYQDVVQALFEKSGLPNSKGLGERMSDKVVYGIDLNRIKASNTKLRDVGGANEKYEDGTVHYASALTVKEFRDLKAYPYVSNPADVRYPNLTVWKMPRGWTANNVVGATRPSSQPVSGKLADYPCLRAILNARETSNEARLWLVMALKNKLKMGEGECTQLLCSNAKWEDLVTDSKGSMGTPYHVHKIYSKKNADGRDAYGKPPKKANLVAEGYCKPGVCGRCKLYKRAEEEGERYAIAESGHETKEGNGKERRLIEILEGNGKDGKVEIDPVLLPTDELELFPPCIRHVLKSVPEKAAAARQVPMIVTQFCVNAGLPDEMVHRLLKPRSNYDETLTQQKINKTRAERLSCYSCEKLATMHLCWRNAICKTLETPNPVGYYRKVRRYV